MRSLALALALAFVAPGCVTIVQTTRGQPIDPQAVGSLEPQRTTLPEVLAQLGAPQEVHRHADGRLLVYRFSVRNAFRLGLNASRLLSFVDTSQVVSEAAGNLRLTLETIHGDEDRVVVLLGDDDVVCAVGYRAGTAELPLVW
jgi:hypothetical protein